MGPYDGKSIWYLLSWVDPYERAERLGNKENIIKDLMNPNQKKEIAKICGPQTRFGEPLSAFTTYRIGGPADAICPVSDAETLRTLLQFLNRIGLPVYVIGRGSNLLVQDEGVRGCVILLRGSLAHVAEDTENSNLLKAGSGLDLTELLNFCKQKGRAGLEFLAGIPGTLGGAIVMNAGAWGSFIGDQVREVLLLECGGMKRQVSAAELKFSYRYTAIPPGAIVAEVVLETTPGDPVKIGEQIKEILLKRKAKQPLEQPSAGSVFKNPSGFYAGQLIEEAGLKGSRIGDALVSPKHANFIVNAGQATAKDVLALIALIQERVWTTRGIRLEPEIKVI
ncbi:MAG: UDP-N-acetylmuramate dehydrogenase [Desulfobacteraceae bacterium]|nr:MAG: UDP-N-acetylmuramate dehydrogenase [Desulfobacteraceae bacterium]